MKIKSQKKSKLGFTLIELVLYASLVSLLVLGVSSFWSVIKQLGLKDKAISAVEEQGAFISDVISQRIREAKKVCIPSSSGTENSGDTLDLDTNCISHTANEIEFAMEAGDTGKLVMTEGGTDEYLLTDERVNISSIAFTKAKDPLGGTASVNFTFTIEARSYSATSEYRYVKTFSGGGTLRLE